MPLRVELTTALVAVLWACLLSPSQVRGDCGLLSAVSKTTGWEDTFCMGYNSDQILLATAPNNFYPALATNETWHEYGCEPVGPEGKGKALVVERGECTFYQKSVSANQSGVVVVVVINNITDLFTPSDNGSSSLVIVTDQDGKRIKAQITALGDVSLAIFSPQVTSWDPGQILIAAIAILALITSTVLANDPVEFLKYGLLIRKGEQKGGEESSSLHMSSTAGLASGLCSFITVIAVIVGLLTLLYFFYYPMVYIVIGLFCIGAAESLYHCMSPLVALIPVMRTWRIPENKLWVLRYQPDPRFFITVAVCTGLVVWWLLERNESYIWVLHDVLGFAYIVFIASVFANMDIPPWYMVLLLLGLCLYDIVAVFITPYFTADGVSVMEKAATGGGGGSTLDCSLRTSGEVLPIVFTVPKLAPSLLVSTCSRYNMRMYMLLGYGDVAVPALFVALCLKFDLKMHPDRKLKLYHLVGCLGYVIGLTATFLSLNFMRQAQPALLFLVPSILIGVLLTAMISGELCLFLTGRPFRGCCRKRKRVRAPKSDIEGKADAEGEGKEGEEEGGKECNVKEEEKETLLSSEQQK
ncbi:hypothetical protein EMCRGX_G030685 [Ephydatia muelleri]